MTRIEFIDMLCKRYGARYINTPILLIQYARDNEWDDEDYDKFNKEFEDDNIVSFY